jgi:DNA anti-recombination protein RmuC
VTWAWILFLLNEFFILIVLLNFLIAIISQAYDEVMTKEEIDRYEARCDLNIEVAIKLDTFDLLLQKLKLKNLLSASVKEQNKVFYLKCNSFTKELENEYLGFVKTIKNAVKVQNKILKNDIKNCFPNSELLTDFSEKFSRIGNLNHTVESKLSEVKNELNSRMNDIKTETNSSIQSVKNDLSSRINETNKSIQAGQEQLSSKLDDQNKEVRDQLKQLTKLIQSIQREGEF